MEVTNEEFFGFVGGSADKDVKRRIAAALEDPKSKMCQLLSKLDAVAEHPLDINWRTLRTAANENDREQEVPAS